jgi:hypothetical protein
MLGNYLSVHGHEPRLLAEPVGAQTTRSDLYKFARGGLCLSSDDSRFSDRFRVLFAECLSSREELAGLPLFSVALTTDQASNTSRISFSASDGLDYCSFVQELFPERSLRMVPDQRFPDWYCLAESPATEPVIAVKGDQLLVDRRYSWQAIVAQFAVNNVMRLQRDVRFFHAATIAIGNRGVFIAGAKGSGKTTLSLALAARSHAFLGDEYAAVCVKTATLLPFRRAVSVRPGARAAKLETRLAGMNPVKDKTEDGSERLRFSVREAFPEVASRPVPLAYCFFLRGFRQKPAVTEFAPGELSLPSLQPLAATLWAQRPGMLMLELLRVFSRARCFHVDAGGTPDETAEFIENVVEGK